MNEPAPGANAPGATSNLMPSRCGGWRHFCASSGVPSRWLGTCDDTASSPSATLTIYRHVWRDLRRGGSLHRQMRGARKQRRKRYGRYDSRGRLAGKRLIGERPASVESRQWVGHWEIDTVLGTTSACVVTLVERATGYLLVGKMAARTTAELNRATLALIRAHPGRFASITADNGTEFHAYKDLEAATGVPFYFATPHHSWERGTNENTNGLLRQYLPKGQSMEPLTQRRCDQIAHHLNERPRKRYDYKTPNQCFNGS